MIHNADKWGIQCKCSYKGDFEQFEAHAEAFNPELKRVHLKLSLMMLNDFITDHIPEQPQIFGNGPEFDNAILEHAMAHFNIMPAWHHGCNQSLRTAVLFGRLLLGYDPKHELEFDGIKHHALDDARHEAAYLHAIVKALNQAVTRG